jgi:hypothetical protein
MDALGRSSPSQGQLRPACTKRPAAFCGRSSWDSRYRVRVARTVTKRRPIKPVQSAVPIARLFTRGGNPHLSASTHLVDVTQEIGRIVS